MRDAQRVIVCGACGKVGREIIKAIDKEKDIHLVAAVDVINVGRDIGEILLGKKNEVIISSSLISEINRVSAGVMVDFTQPQSVMENIRCALRNKVPSVIGTTGILAENLKEIEKLCIENNTSCLVAPNFALGAVLLMKFAKEAAKYFPQVEIIEMHHDKKLDAPSGTSIKTAIMIKEGRGKMEEQKVGEMEKIENVRGGNFEGVRIHSVRLPGLVAHQEVIFGGVGQILTIRHDSISRESFIPGIFLAIRKIKEVKGLIYGLENLI